MPSSVAVNLNPVATEYLRNYDDLEAAREMFLSERARLLDCLGDVMMEAANGAKQAVDQAKRDDRYGVYDVYIKGSYTALRAAGGDKRSSGYSTAIGSLHGHVGAQTLLWFQLKLNPARAKRLELAALCKQLGADAKVVGEGGSSYLITATQGASSLDLDTLKDEAARLPALFVMADAWITKRWST